MEGKFIVLEGIEGVNLEKIGQELIRTLEGEGIERHMIHLTREPSDGPIGRDIRLVLDGRLNIDKRTLAVLFAADRLDHLQVPETGIEARLANGEWVISDRYYLSHYAFQTYQGFELEWLQALNKYCRKPDVIFYIELPIEKCVHEYLDQKRLKGYHHFIATEEEEPEEEEGSPSTAPDEKEKERVEAYLKKIQASYHKAIEQLRGKDSIVPIRATLERQVIRQIISEIEKRKWL